MEIRKSNYRKSLAKVALLGFMAVCGAATPAQAQETVAGKFSLTESARLCGKVLPAGAYTFTVEPAVSSQSMASIEGNRQKVMVTVRSEAKGGPVAAIFATAWKTYPSAEGSKLVLTPTGDGRTIQSMHLGEQGLELEFE